MVVIKLLPHHLRKGPLPALLLNLAAALMLTPGLRAQEGNTFYQMQYLPQNNLLNPAVRSTCSYYIGLPFLGSISAGYHNPVFSYNDLIADGKWNLEGLAKQVHRRDLYSLELGIPLLLFGFHLDKHYFHFHAGERALIHQGIPGDLVELGVYGNGPSAGEQIGLNSLRSAALHMREYALAYSRAWDEQWTFGLRLKLLFGKANLHTPDSRANLRTDEDDFSLYAAADYRVRSSFPLIIETDAEGVITGVELGPIETLSYLMNASNPGVGLDLGATWDYSEQWRFSASLLDLGALWWRSELNEVRSEGNFVFEGPDELDAASWTSYGQALLDSLANTFMPVTDAVSYASPLSPRLFLSAGWQYLPELSFGLTGQGIFYRSKLQMALTLSADYRVAGDLHATASWSWMNNRLSNLGLGLAWSAPGLQFHILSDNILAALRPMDSHSASIRMGMALQLGCQKDRAPRQTGSSYGPVPMPPCKASDPDKERKKRMRKARRINR